MIDFERIKSETNLYNFHSHTQFCDGREPMEEFIKEAINLNFIHFGFSPHSPIPFPTSCNMLKDDVPEYFIEIKRLQDRYGDKIKIYSSMEIDFVDTSGPAFSYFQNLPLDYRIGSIHFIPSFKNPKEYIDVDGNFENFRVKMNTYFDNDIENVVRSFYHQSMKMVEQGGFDIIGHFDKIGHNASDFQPGIEDAAWYDKLVKELFEAIMDHHYMIEINTKKLDSDNRLFPSLRYFKLLKKYNAPILFNSDVHYPKLVNAGRFEAMKLYENA